MHRFIMMVKRGVVKMLQIFDVTQVTSCTGIRNDGKWRNTVKILS